jgi:hypothetical protein
VTTTSQRLIFVSWVRGIGGKMNEGAGERFLEGVSFVAGKGGRIHIYFLDA